MRREMQQEASYGKVGARGAKEKSSSSSTSCFWSFWMFMVTVLLIALGFGTSLLWIYTGGHLDQQSIERALPMIHRDFDIQWNKLSQALAPHVKSLKENCRWLWDEFNRRNDYVAHYINTNWGPTWCSAKKTAMEYLSYAQKETLVLWERARPHLIKSIEWINHKTLVCWKWLQLNLPIYMDYAYGKCHEWYLSMESSYQQWMKTWWKISIVYFFFHFYQLS